jgi:hypothetical protein
MNTSPAPDVDRVLNRMGRSAFGYRSFANPIDELAPMERIADEPATAPEAAPGSFSLVNEALPAVAPPEVAAPANQFRPPIQSPPEPASAQAPSPRTTPLSHAFRILSGHVGGASERRPFDGHETAFPFRRR